MPYSGLNLGILTLFFQNRIGVLPPPLPPCFLLFFFYSDQHQNAWKQLGYSPIEVFNHYVLIKMHLKFFYPKPDPLLLPPP